MKILYVILTADKFFGKQELQKNTWLKFVGEKDEYIYLNSLSKHEDSYDNVPLKYSYFIRDFHRFNEFDWVFFCDDDTFVFPKKLSHLLSYQDAKKPIMIGRTGTYQGWTVCSGGAGFAVSNCLILKVKSYLHNQFYEHFPNSDTTFGRWAKLAVPEVSILDRTELLQTQHLRHNDNALVDIDSCISFHYCDSYDFSILSKHLKQSVH